MKITDMGEVFNNVTVMYPRINRTYRFDNMEMKTVPCDPMDDGAAYELQFTITKDEAIEVMKHAKAIYDAADKKDEKRDWPKNMKYTPLGEYEKVVKAMKGDEDVFTIKAKLKGAYGTDKTRPPLQRDASNKDLPADFLLTSNSKCNVWGVMFAYNTGAVSGVSFRLKGVQVLELAEMQASGNPFEETSGYTNGASNDDPFGLPPTQPAVKEAPKASADFDDEIPF